LLCWEALEGDQMSVKTIRGCGVAVALGGIVWGAAWLLSPSQPDRNSHVEIWASGVFQLGLFALLAVMWATAATGIGRWARTALVAEGVAVALAFAWTVPYLFDANRPDNGLLLVLDPFWPLSMVGLIVIGVLVVRARRWPAPLRYLPLAASLLIPIDIAVAWAPNALRPAITGVYMALAYGVLGLGIARAAARLDAFPHYREPVEGHPS
jgi:hypothetical protein